VNLLFKTFDLFVQREKQPKITLRTQLEQSCADRTQYYFEFSWLFKSSITVDSNATSLNNECFACRSHLPVTV